MAYVGDEGAHVPAQAGRDDQPLVTLAEAAALTGRSITAVRAVLRRDLERPEGERRLNARKNNAGEWLVSVPATWRRQAMSYAVGQDGHASAIAAQQAGHADDDPATLTGRLDALEQALAGRLTDLQRELAAAQVALAKAEAERDAAQAVAAAKETAAEYVIDLLNKQIAELRRPWWRRWRTS